MLGREASALPFWAVACAATLGTELVAASANSGSTFFATMLFSIYYFFELFERAKRIELLNRAKAHLNLP